jgi:AcrR family transcriptional regulator
MNEYSFIYQARGYKVADRETRKKQITAQRQEQILRAAMEVFSRKGFAAATVPEIAGEAGVAAGTIYLYYPSKRDLFVAVIQRLLINPLANIINKDIGRDFSLTIQEALMDRLRLLQSGNLPQFIALMSEIHRDPELKALLYEKVMQPFLNMMEAMYRRRMAAGELPKMDPAMAVRLVGGMIVGLIILKSIEGKASPLNRLSEEQIMNEVLLFISGGLMARKEQEAQNE